MLFSHWTPICSIFCSLNCFRDGCPEQIQVKVTSRVICILEVKSLDTQVFESKSRMMIQFRVFQSVFCEALRFCRGAPGAATRLRALKKAGNSVLLPSDHCCFYLCYTGIPVLLHFTDVAFYLSIYLFLQIEGKILCQ